jgi:hypothetical protein
MWVCNNAQHIATIIKQPSKSLDPVISNYVATTTIVIMLTNPPSPFLFAPTLISTIP